jgi:hypothetical protein
MMITPTPRASAPGQTSRPILRLRRAAALSGVLAAVALAAAGCGSSSGSGSSTGSTPAASGGGPASSQTANSNKLAEFSQCMRAHGLADFPDPVNGHLNLRVSKGSDLDPSAPAFQAALRACKSLEPAGFAGSGGGQSNQQQSQLLKFVSCMRSHGVANMPDPQPNGTMLMSGGQIDPNSPQFQSAMQACRSLLPAGAVGG